VHGDGENRPRVPGTFHGIEGPGLCSSRSRT
jgi:hypothetical protein